MFINTIYHSNLDVEREKKVFLNVQIASTLIILDHSMFSKIPPIRYIMDRMRKIVQCTSLLYATTVCPRRSDPFYVVTYYIKWVTTSWTYTTKGSQKRSFFSGATSFFCSQSIIIHILRSC